MKYALSIRCEHLDVTSDHFTSKNFRRDDLHVTIIRMQFKLLMHLSQLADIADFSMAQDLEPGLDHLCHCTHSRLSSCK